ncbi:unnamed protein product, partial [Rotaria magnacalcarata]
IDEVSVVKNSKCNYNILSKAYSLLISHLHMMNQSQRERRQNRDQEGRENFIDFGTSNDYWSWRAQESAVHYLNPNQSAPQQPCSTNFRCYGTSNQPQEPRSASYRKKNSTRTGVHIEQRPHSDQNGVHQSPRPTQGEKIPNDSNQRNECRLPQQKVRVIIIV